MQPCRNRDLPYGVAPTNIPGAFATVGALEDFDPRMASTAALINHGLLWRRPGPGDNAALRAAWDRTFSRVWCAQDRTIPHLEPQIGRTHNLRQARRVSDHSFTSQNWAGASIEGTWTSVTGHWVIPTVSQSGEPQGSEGGWNSASWVGINGTYGSDDILQAGVEQRIDANRNTSYVVWCEWFVPDCLNSPSYIFQTNISNFAVSPGDTVYCSVQYTGPMVLPDLPGRHQIPFNSQQQVNYLDAVGRVHGLHDSTAAANRKMPCHHSTAGRAYFASSMPRRASTSPSPWNRRQAPRSAAHPPNGSWRRQDGVEPTSCLPRFTPVQFTPAICCGASTVNDPVNGDTWNITRRGQMMTSVTLDHDAVTIDYIGP